MARLFARARDEHGKRGKQQEKAKVRVFVSLFVMGKGSQLGRSASHGPERATAILAVKGDRYEEIYGPLHGASC